MRQAGPQPTKPRPNHFWFFCLHLLLSASRSVLLRGLGMGELAHLSLHNASCFLGLGKEAFPQPEGDFPVFPTPQKQSSLPCPGWLVDKELV